MVLISLVSVLNLLYFYISTFRSMCVCIIITIIITHLYARYLHLCTWKSYVSQGTLQCCSYPVATVCRHALTFPMPNALYLYIRTLCSSVQYTIWLLSGSSWISLLRYWLNDCQMVPVGPSISSITSVLHYTNDLLLLSSSSSSSTCGVTWHHFHY